MNRSCSICLFDFLSSSCFLTLLLLILMGCGSDPCLEKYDQTTCRRVMEKAEILNDKVCEYEMERGQLINDFHSFLHDLDHPKTLNDSVDVYIDKSVGMKEMIASLQRNTVWPTLINTISSEKTNWYFVQGAKSPKDYVIKSTENPPAFGKLMNQDSFFTEVGSPLDSALAKITHHKDKQSVFITDGELARINDYFIKADGKSTIINHGEAWAKGMITSWLRDGNIIDIFVSSYFNGAAQDTMRGFVMIFTPYSLVNIETNVYSRIAGNMNSQKQIEISHLHFNYYDFQIHKNRKDLPRHLESINERFIEEFGQNGFSVSQDVSNRFEHFDFNFPISDFQDFIYNWISQDFDDYTDKPIKPRKLFSNILFSEGSPVFDSVKLGIKVYNIDETISDFIQFKKLMWADTVVDENGKVIWCIDDFDYPEIIPVFEENKSPLFIPDCFTIGTHQSNKYIDLFIEVIEDDMFNFNDFSVANNLKIDVVIEEFYSLGIKKRLKPLIWNNHNFKDPIMDGLYKSIEYSYAEDQPFIKKKPVYTFYLTFEDN